MNIAKILIIGSVTLLIVFVFLIYLGVIPGLKFQFRNIPPSDIEIWGVFDDSDAISPLIQAFQVKNPSVTISYRKKSIQNYEKELVRAFAVGKGPDIFMINNSWLGRYKDLLYPAPQKIISLSDFQRDFVDVARKDFIDNGIIYGMPLYVDTLALYYNVDLFNSAGLINPPKDWDEFEKYSKILTKKTVSGDILVSGSAMGSGKNILNSVDILSLLMLQKGSKLSDDKGRIIFDNEPGAIKAFNFYTKFAKPESNSYSWSQNFPNDSQDMFAQGRAAMMFGYSYARNNILRKAPRLRFGISYMPQIKNSILKKNYADYWGYGVYVKSAYSEAAWSFLKFLSEPKNAGFYLSSIKSPASQKSILFTQQNNPKLAVFADQALTADSWLQLNSDIIKNILEDMIDSQVVSEQSANIALRKAAAEINSKILSK
jgi:multiple sugar transport system substrate-binding protein